MILEQLFVYFLFGKGSNVVSEIDREIYKVIRESADPEMVAQYFLNLCLDYLRTRDPFQASDASAPQESALVNPTVPCLPR